jgi:hypothetical protein
MDKIGIKATLYDIIGYVIPGFLFLLFIYIFKNNLDLKWLLSLKKVDISAPYIVVIFILTYVSGHIVSSFSSFIFEGYISKWITNKLFPKPQNSIYDIKTQSLFGKPFNDCDQRSIITYCQEKHPIVYETAFVFLTIYGLSRNVAATFIVLSSFSIYKYGICSIESLIIISSTILLIRNYYRFKVNFTKQINSSLLLD